MTKEFDVIVVGSGPGGGGQCSIHGEHLFHDAYSGKIRPDQEQGKTFNCLWQQLRGAFKPCCWLCPSSPQNDI